jgi:hypothetical protein
MRENHDEVCQTHPRSQSRGSWASQLGLVSIPWWAEGGKFKGPKGWRKRRRFDARKEGRFVQRLRQLKRIEVSVMWESLRPATEDGDEQAVRRRAFLVKPKFKEAERRGGNCQILKFTTQTRLLQAPEVTVTQHGRAAYQGIHRGISPQKLANTIILIKIIVINIIICFPFEVP